MKNGVRVEKSKKKITSCNYYVEYDRVKEGEAGGEGEKERERDRERERERENVLE